MIQFESLYAGQQELQLSLEVQLERSSSLNNFIFVNRGYDLGRIFTLINISKNTYNYKSIIYNNKCERVRFMSKFYSVKVGDKLKSIRISILRFIP